MTLESNQNFPAYMVVGGPSASVTYLISNTLGGPIPITAANIVKNLLPKESSLVFEPGTGVCSNLENNKTCQLKITLNPVNSGAVQDIVQQGPRILISFGGYPFITDPPLDQRISVRVFPEVKTLT